MGKTEKAKGSKTVRRDSVDNPTQISQNQESIQIYFSDNSDNITNKAVIQSDQSNRPSQNQSYSSHSIHKSRRHKKHNPDDKFLPAHIKRYYLFPFHYSSKNPFFKISWKQWKPNSVYKRMAEFLSDLRQMPNKTSIQCKSYDQRMKQQHYNKQSDINKHDLLESSLLYLENEKLQTEALDVITNYIDKMKEKSDYIQFLEESAQNEQHVKMEDQFCNQCNRDDSTFLPNINEVDLNLNDFQNRQPVQLNSNDFYDVNQFLD